MDFIALAPSDRDSRVHIIDLRGAERHILIVVFVLLFDFLLLYLLFEFQNLGLALLKRLWHALTIFLDELAKFS